jgi:hypothetical protein
MRAHFTRSLAQEVERLQKDNSSSDSQKADLENKLKDLQTRCEVTKRQLEQCLSRISAYTQTDSALLDAANDTLKLRKVPSRSPSTGERRVSFCETTVVKLDKTSVTTTTSATQTETNTTQTTTTQTTLIEHMSTRTQTDDPVTDDDKVHKYWGQYYADAEGAEEEEYDDDENGEWEQPQDDSTVQAMCPRESNSSETALAIPQVPKIRHRDQDDDDNGRRRG